MPRTPAGQRAAPRAEQRERPRPDRPASGPLDGARPPAVPDGAVAPAPIADVPRRTLLGVVRIALVTLAVIVAFSVTGTAEMAPGHALVYAQPAAGTYYSPSCAVGKDAPQLTTIDAATAAGLRPDGACWSDGGFLGAGGSRWMELLRRAKLYPARQSRWRADGTWRW